MGVRKGLLDWPGLACWVFCKVGWVGSFKFVWVSWVFLLGWLFIKKKNEVWESLI